MLNNHFKTITVTGVGHRLWRELYFPSVSQSLFKQLVQRLEEQENENETSIEADVNSSISEEISFTEDSAVLTSVSANQPLTKHSMNVQPSNAARFEKSLQIQPPYPKFHAKRMHAN